MVSKRFLPNFLSEYGTASKGHIRNDSKSTSKLEQSLDTKNSSVGAEMTYACTSPNQSPSYDNLCHQEKVRWPIFRIIRCSGMVNSRGVQEFLNDNDESENSDLTISNSSDSDAFWKHKGVQKINEEQRKEMWMVFFTSGESNLEDEDMKDGKTSAAVSSSGNLASSTTGQGPNCTSSNPNGRGKPKIYRKIQHLHSLPSMSNVLIADQATSSSNQKHESGHTKDNEKNEKKREKDQEGVVHTMKDDASTLIRHVHKRKEHKQGMEAATSELDEANETAVCSVTGKKRFKRAIFSASDSNHVVATEMIHGLACTSESEDYEEHESKNSKIRSFQGGVNVLECLPQQLINGGFITSASKVLKDVGFISQRLSKLGYLRGAEIHVEDCQNFMNAVDIKVPAIHSKNRDVGVTKTDPKDVVLDACYAFKSCILSIYDTDQSPSLKSKGNEKNCHGKNEKVFSCFAGRALFSLGKFLHDRNWIDDAIPFYISALEVTLRDHFESPTELLQKETHHLPLDIIYTSMASSLASSTQIDHEYVALVMNRLGDCHWNNGQLDKALHAYSAALVNLESILDTPALSVPVEVHADQPQVFYAATEMGRTLNRIGVILGSCGEPRDALEFCQKAIELQTVFLGQDHTEVAFSLHNIGVVYDQNEEFDLAMEYYEKALQIFRTKTGLPDLCIARTLRNLGGIHQRRNKFQEAINCFEEVLRIQKKVLSNYHPSIASTLRSLSENFRQSGQLDEATVFHEEADRNDA